MTPTISAKRIGYLRLARPAHAAAARSPSAPITSMWRKLSADGLIEMNEDGEFRRTAAGEKALHDFDANLSEAVRSVLNAVKAEASGAAAMKGIMPALNSGLVRHVDKAPHYVLTEAGKALADPIGEDGYFEKSGNLVRVHSVCTERGYEGMLDVERLEGESKGKRLLIPRDAFVRKADWEEMTAG